MRAIMSGDVTPGQVGGFLMALRTKGETVDELDGLARTVLEFAHPVSTPAPVLDTCGTGGDRSGTFNISTLSAIVVAGAGVPVAKHGNRAASSHCGSADLLEALGVKIDLDAAGVERCLAEVGHRLHVRSGLPSRVRPRGAGPRRAPGADLVQLPGTAHEPCPTGCPGRRRLRRADASAHGGGARAPRDPRQAVPRRGRSGRAHDHEPVAGAGRPRGRRPREPARPRRARDREGVEGGPPRRRRRRVGAHRPRGARRRRRDRDGTSCC